MNRQEVLQDYMAYISEGKVRFFTKYHFDVVMGKRENIFLYDVDGREFINCHCNGGVFNLGHRHPELVKTLCEAAERLDIGNHHLISVERAALGKQLAELLPEGLSKCVFSSGGGEAIDLALKIAKGHTRRRKIISARGAYHGHTGLAILTGEEKFRAPFGLASEDFIQVPFNDLHTLERVIDSDTAAVILEPIPATAGVLLPDEDYLLGVEDLCSRHGALLIADEVQTGLGRTGKFWAVEHYGVIPDILVTGKGLSGGLYPMAATCYKPELDHLFIKDPFLHISTFGGSELGCAVAQKVLAISSEPAFLEHVNRMAAIIKEKVEQLQAENKKALFTFRQKGLMMALDFGEEVRGMVACKVLLDHGIFTVFSGNNPAAVQFLPPLIITEDQIELLFERLKNALKEMNSLKVRMMIQSLKLFSN